MLSSAAHRARLRGTDLVIAVAQSTADVLRRKWGAGAPLTVVRNGVDVPAVRAAAAGRRRAPGEGLRILSLSRLAPEKNLDRLIAALPALLERDPGARLTLAGSGPLEGQLRAQAEALGVAEAVDLPGFVEPWETMAEHDVLVQLSAWENLSYTLLDAAAAGLPAVATDVGGNGEILPPERLVHETTPAAPGGMTVEDWKSLHAALKESRKPLFITGGNDWTDEGAQTLTTWLEEHKIPAAAEWRTEGTVPFSSPSYVGPIGYGRPKPTYDMLEETDLIVFVGTVPGDAVTNGFTIRQNWDKKNFLVTIDPSLRGRSGPVSHQIVAKPDGFIRDLVRMELEVKPEWEEWTSRMRGEQEKFAALPPAEPSEGQAKMATLMANLVPKLPKDSMISLGAGEHTNWAHRYFPTEGYRAMISARNGSMGYSVPGAVAASLNFPDRTVVTIAGDGEFWYNDNTHQVEVGAQSDWSQLLGPFGTREEAQAAMDRVRANN